VIVWRSGVGWDEGSGLSWCSALEGEVSLCTDAEGVRGGDKLSWTWPVHGCA
jgi:hypothetical protein